MTDSNGGGTRRQVPLRTAKIVAEVEQGVGWLSSEELWWDAEGRLRTHAPSTYKIPLASDRPRVFNTALAEWSENREATIRRSKAVGEPPLAWRK